MECDLEIVNMVGSGKFDLEIELSAVAQESMFVENEWIQSVEHSRRSGNRLNISFTSTGGHGVLAPSGVHVITGVDSQRELDQSQVALYNALELIGLLDTNEPEDVDLEENFKVRNIVCVADLGSRINLNAAAIDLGLEFTEYEPEQFPGLVYRPESYIGTVLLFASGKAVVTGAAELESARQTLQALEESLSEMVKST
jgi:transcription initiation factor TFIID TATA-box-binding protein